MLKRSTKGWQYALFTVFSLSGFSGLIYESVWTNYLKLFLGHAAYAQTLVLALFMGGMAGGAWLAGRFMTRIKNPLLAYAAVESIIGIFGLQLEAIFKKKESSLAKASAKKVNPSDPGLPVDKYTTPFGIGSPSAISPWRCSI